MRGADRQELISRCALQPSGAILGPTLLGSFYPGWEHPGAYRPSKVLLNPGEPAWPRDAEPESAGAALLEILPCKSSH